MQPWGQTLDLPQAINLTVSLSSPVGTKIPNQLEDSNFRLSTRLSEHCYLTTNQGVWRKSNTLQPSSQILPLKLNLCKSLGNFFFKICKIWSGDPSGRKMVIITGNIIEIGPRAGVQWLLNVFNMTITLVTVWCQPTFLTLLPTLPCALSFSLMRTIISKLFSCRHTNWHAPIHSLTQIAFL